MNFKEKFKQLQMSMPILNQSEIFTHENKKLDLIAFFNT